MLKKEYRLKKNKEFARVYKRGKSAPMPVLVAYSAKNKYNKEGYRVGFSASKKIGNAVVRNRCKRLFREAAKSCSPCFTPGWDYIFIIRNGAVGLSLGEITAQMAKALTKLSRPPQKKQP